MYDDMLCVGNPDPVDEIDASAVSLQESSLA